MPQQRLTEDEKRLFEQFLMPKFQDANAMGSSFDVASSTAPVTQRGSMPTSDFRLTMDDVTRPRLTDQLLASLPQPETEAPLPPPSPVAPRPAPMAKKPINDVEVIQSFMNDVEPEPEIEDEPAGPKFDTSRLASTIGQALAGFGDAMSARGGRNTSFLKTTMDSQDKLAKEAKEEQAMVAAAEKEKVGADAYQKLVKQLFPDVDVSNMSTDQIKNVLGPIAEHVERQEAQRAAEEARPYEKQKRDLELATGQAQLEKIRAEMAAKGMDPEESKEKMESLNAYMTARKDLASSLSSTSFPIVAGRLPALTSGQQEAAGAIGNLKPILQRIFVKKGGTMNKEVDRMLDNMMPNRSDNKAAVRAKLENLDRLVMSSLGLSGETVGGAAPSGPAVGSIESGYRFKGGDASDPNNWEPVS